MLCCRASSSKHFEGVYALLPQVYFPSGGIRGVCRQGA